MEKKQKKPNRKYPSGLRVRRFSPGKFLWVKFRERGAGRKMVPGTGFSPTGVAGC
jgi:hypothetical protein